MFSAAKGGKSQTTSVRHQGAELFRGFDALVGDYVFRRGAICRLGCDP